MNKKILIFDSSTIITLAMNGLLGILPQLKKNFKGSFVITPYVKEEIINQPLETKRFEFEALSIEKLIEDGIFDIMDAPELDKETSRIKLLVNSSFKAHGEKLKIFHDGEASCLALAKLLYGNEILLASDERTARLVIENLENLRKLFEYKLHTVVDLKYLKGIPRNLKIIRSSELCMLAYKKGFIDLPADHSKVIEAILYALKFKGCSISSEEIKKAKKIFERKL